MDKQSAVLSGLLNYKGYLDKDNPNPALPAKNGDMYVVHSDILHSSELIRNIKWNTVLTENPPVYNHDGEDSDRLILLCIEDDVIGYAPRWELIIVQAAIK